MVTILKVKNEDNTDVNFKIIEDFKDIHNFSAFDRMLVKHSECGKYEYLYLFLNQLELDTFINLLLNNNITIFSKKDFTEDLVNIVINDKLDTFKNDFDVLGFEELMGIFYIDTITTDMVLDKISFNGKDSLTKNDYNILAQ